jgi:hypothetical protein
MSIGNKSTRDKRLNNGPYAITDSQMQLNETIGYHYLIALKTHILIRIKDIKVKRHVQIKIRHKRRII